jgi:tetratricopeptide (TPR) repeat protein
MRQAVLFLMLVGLARAERAVAQVADHDALPERSSRKLFDQGRAALGGGDYPRAVELLESAVQRDPDAVSYRAALAEAYERAGRREEAAQTHARIGDAYLAQGKGALAAEAFTRAEALGLNDPNLHVQLARAYCVLEQYLGAVTTRRLDSAEVGHIVREGYVLEPVPNQPDTYRVCPPASAIYQLQAVLDAGLDSVEVHLLRADVWLHARRYDRALAAYRAVEDRVPIEERAAYYARSAQAALGADELEEYLARLERAIELDPETYRPRREDAYRNLAERYTQRGDLAATIRYLKLAIQEEPEDADLHYRLGNVYWETRRAADAAGQWRITLELRPDHPDRRRMLTLIRSTMNAEAPHQ